MAAVAAGDPSPAPLRNTAPAPEAALETKTAERRQLPALLRDLRATPVGPALADAIIDAADTVVALDAAPARARRLAGRARRPVATVDLIGTT